MANTPVAKIKNRIRFSFDEMINELTCMSNVANNFLRSNPIPQLITDLESIRYSNKSTPQNWAIEKSKPLVTKICSNGYEPGTRKCTYKSVYGELTCIWQVEVEILGTPRKREIPKHFFLNGLSSTKICLFNEQDPIPLPLAQWQFEVGDSSSPGCHFHCGILQTEDAPPFPKGLSVPRLPSILITPMDGLDFMLSELLQRDWTKHTSEGKYDSIQWSKIQRKRFVKLMEWSIRKVEGSQNSAWLNLKRAKPLEGELFA